jgi:hypothetical protein
MARKKVPKAAADSPSLACDDASQEVGEVRNLEARILKWREGEVLSRAGKRRERERAAERGDRERDRDGRRGQLDEQAMQVPRGQSGVTRGQSCGPRRRIRETPDAMSALESTPRFAGLSGGLMGPCHGGNFSRILLLYSLLAWGKSIL